MLKTCDNVSSQLALYLDDELDVVETKELEAHLRGCDSCRAVADHERRFLTAVRRSRPLYDVPGQLRARIADLIGSYDLEPLNAPAARNRIERPLAIGSRWPPRPQLLVRLTVIAASIFMALLIGLVALNRYTGRSHPNTSDFALAAAETHLRYVRGQLPLEIASNAPNEISQWFAGKVPFFVQLPNYQETSGQEKLYELEGGRLVGYKDDYAAYVAYRMRNSPIGLVITSDKAATPSGGEQIISKEITFHYNSISGLKVITWSDRGLTYALVSALDERGQQSCIVCHQGAKDRDFIDSLKPR